MERVPPKSGRALKSTFEEICKKKTFSSDLIRATHMSGELLEDEKECLENLSRYHVSGVGGNDF